jgi:hypothetical protein
VAIIFVRNITNGVGEVASVVFQKEQLDEDTLKKGVEVNDSLIPEFNDALLIKYDLVTGKFFYDDFELDLTSKAVVGKKITDLEIKLIRKDREVDDLAKMVVRLEIQLLKSKKEVRS